MTKRRHRQIFNSLTREEQNMVLYYADFLSLKKCSKPVTDNCKYYFINGLPINSAYLVDAEPEYQKANKFICQALKEYRAIKHRFGADGAESFIGDIGMLRARGCIDAISILQQIHIYSTRKERKYAFKEYYSWIKRQKYIHETINEDGKTKKSPCTRYVAHAEKSLKKRNLPKNLGYNFEKLEDNT